MVRKKKIPYIDEIEGEIWKDVLGFENIYLVSNIGRIMKLPTKGIIKEVYGNRVCNYQKRIIKFSKNPNGYLQVVLHTKEKKETKYAQ